MGGWIVVMIMDDDVNNVIFMDTLREAFKKKNYETYGIFHMWVDPPPSIYGKSSVIFFIV